MALNSVHLYRIRFDLCHVVDEVKMLHGSTDVVQCGRRAQKAMLECYYRQVA